MRKRTLAAAIGLALLAGTADGKPVAGRRLGVGLIGGEPTGLSAYLSLSDNLAVDLALGWVSWAHRDEEIGHADLLWLLAELGRGEPTSVPLYLGAGIFVLDDRGDWFGGLRLPFGVAVHVRPARLQIFGELALQVLVAGARETPRHTDGEAAFGLRFFF